jgi:hypothetical protein
LRSGIPIHPNRDRESGDFLLYNQNPNKTPPCYPYLYWDILRVTMTFVIVII